MNLLFTQRCAPPGDFTQPRGLRVFGPVGDPVLGFVVGDPVLGFVVESCCGSGLLMLWVVVVVVLPLRGTCGGTVLRSAVGPGPQSHLQFL